VIISIQRNATKGRQINYKIAYSKLESQLKFQKKGKTIFIPGNHDWYNIKGLERQEEIVTDYFDDKESFSPRKGCPIDDEKITSALLQSTVNGFLKIGIKPQQ
jgi:hypothetical protein